MRQSVTMGAYSHGKDPTNEYLLLTAKTGWEALRICTSITEPQFLERLEQ